MAPSISDKDSLLLNIKNSLLQNLRPLDLVAKNFIFMIDLSSEMNTGGYSLSKTIETMKIVLKSIPVGSKFNIVSFG